jgi:hypothetical protein
VSVFAHIQDTDGGRFKNIISVSSKSNNIVLSIDVVALFQYDPYCPFL